MPVDEAGLDHAQRRDLASRLGARLDELQNEVDKERADRREAKLSRTSEVRDSTDESIAGAADDTSAGVLAVHERELSAVRAALARVDDDMFGLCVSCGLPIGLARLEAQPAASRCVTCQEAREER